MFLYAKLLKARLTADISRTDTIITIDDTSKLPVLASGQYFNLILEQSARTEQLTCTAVSGNDLTVVRGTYSYPFFTDALCTISIDPYGYELTGSGSGLELYQVLTISSLRV